MLVCSSLRIGLNNIFLTPDSVKKKSKLSLRFTLMFNPIPHNQRMAAVRLYELGAKNTAINILITQLNLYKQPGTARKTICETCVNTAIALGRLGDSRAELPLLEALGSLPYFGDSFALSLFYGGNPPDKIRSEASLDTERGLHALIALGYMKDESALPSLLNIFENKTAYDKKFESSFPSSGVSYYVYKLLGLYNEEHAEKIFLSNLSDSYIDIFLMEYVHIEMFPQSYSIGNEVGWLITRKYGWDKYVDSDAARFACMSVFLTSWDEYFKTDCPFEHQDDVSFLKNAIRRKARNSLPKV